MAEYQLEKIYCYLGDDDLSNGLSNVMWGLKQAKNFSEGLAGVKLGGKFGYIDRTGNIVIRSKYDSVEPFSEGLAKVSVIKNKQSPLKRWFNGDDHKYGFIDKNGKPVIECKYDWIDDFSEGLAVASLDGKWVSSASVGLLWIMENFTATPCLSSYFIRTNRGS